MNDLPFIAADRLWSLLPMRDAIDVLEAAFAATDIGAPTRSHVAVPAGDLLVMPAHGPQGVGVKLVTVTPDNPSRGLPLIHGLYALFAADTMAPTALIDGAALTGLRTAAVSGLATRHLARDDATRLVVFGAGAQARTHVAAMRAVRPIDHVSIVSRTMEAAEVLVEELRAQGIDARAGTPAAVGRAHVVCTCTTSASPVVDGALLADGVHINAVGAYRPTIRELDTRTLVRGRGRIVVEQRDAALDEAGDLVLAMREGALSRDDIAADLAEVVAGAPVRGSGDDITVFKSVGLAMEDLAVAAAAVARLDR
ncbi:MAG TPA: ornithine cyclodeaminase family protein [Euzebyales bacterium]|nr:ornithine cyclodeaminase family protein [Euzebyales bacterium]